MKNKWSWLRIFGDPRDGSTNVSDKFVTYSTAMNLVFSHRLMQWRKHYFENSTKLKKPFIIKPLLKRAMKQEMKMTTNMQLRTRTLATWTSAIWEGKMVKCPISCPLIGLMYQCVLKASCLTFTVLIRKCNFSLGCFYPICLNVNKC